VAISSRRKQAQFDRRDHLTARGNEIASLRDAHLHRTPFGPQAPASRRGGTTCGAPQVQVSRWSPLALSLSKVAALRKDTLGGPLTLSQWPLTVITGSHFDFGRRGRTTWLCMQSGRSLP
jgi:hypothetical protein